MNKGVHIDERVLNCDVICRLTRNIEIKFLKMLPVNASVVGDDRRLRATG